MINNEILEEVKTIIFEQLCKNQLLLKIYSKEEVKRRIDTHIQEIQTNIKNSRCSGYCDIYSPTITLCYGKPNGKPLTIEEIKSKKQMLETLIHEAVHAILKNKSGTGMLKLRKENEKAKKDKVQGKSEFTEIGRGINEGFTNWIVEGSGIKTTSYALLTNICKQLELCIGEENLIKFAEGNYDKILKRLNMSKTYGTEFLRQIDEIYDAEYALGDMQQLENYLFLKLTNLKGKDKLTEEEKEHEQEKKADTEKTKIYRELFTDKVLQRLQDLEAEEQLWNINVKADKIHEYEILLDTLRNEYIYPEKEKLSILVDMVETRLIHSLVENRMDNPQSIEEISRIMKFITMAKNALNIYNSNCITFNKLRNKIEPISNRMLKQIYSEIDALIDSGKLTGETLKQEYDKINSLFYSESYEKICKIDKMFAAYIGNKTNNPQEYTAMIEFIIRNNAYDRASKLSVQKSKSGKNIFFEDGKLVTATMDTGTWKNKSLNASQDIIDMIYWTISLSTDYQKIINGFLALRDQKLEENPDATITILEKMIVICNKGQYEFYDIVDGENSGIQRTELIYDEPIKSIISDPKVVESKELVPMSKKNNFMFRIKRGIQTIRNKLKRNNKYRDGENIVYQKSDRGNDFIEKLEVQPQNYDKTGKSNLNPENEREEIYK